MAISRAAVLTGHAVGSILQMVLAVGAVVAVAVLLGYRPSPGPSGWLGLAAVVPLVSTAVTWVAIALGLGARSVESASNTPMVLFLLPFLGSGFVPVDSPPSGPTQASPSAGRSCSPQAASPHAAKR